MVTEIVAVKQICFKPLGFVSDAFAAAVLVIKPFFNDAYRNMAFIELKALLE
jgi:hypothetical protein